MGELVELLRASLPEAIGGLILTAVLAAIVTLYRKREKIVSLWHRLPLWRKGVEIDRTTQVMGQPLLADSELFGPFHLTGERLIARVHQQYEPSYSHDVHVAFEELNAKKRNKGLFGYYSGPRFRLIVPPRMSDAILELDLTPLDYAFVALMKDEETDISTKQKVREKIARVAEQLPLSLQSDHPQINAHSYSILGTMICLITSDGLTLLRRRGKSVLTGRGRWDVSVSGHPVAEDLKNNQLDLAWTVQRETEVEIGSIGGDPRRIVFTGLHHNKVYEDIDLLAFWPIDDNAERLGELINEKYPGQRTRIFKTTERARERYVWETDNLLVEFNGCAILQALQEEGVTLEDFVPEALVCLELALMAQGRPTLGLGVS